MSAPLPPPSAQQRARLQVALEHFNAGRLEYAEQAAAALLVERPGDGVLINLLAGVAFKRGAFVSAAEFLREAAAVSPKDPMIAYNLGEALRRTGQHHDAIVQYKRAKALNSQMFAADAMRGEALRALGEANSAQKAYEAALALNPKNVTALNGLGALRQQAGDAAGAVTFFERAVAAGGPEVGLIWANLGAALNQLGRTHDAIAALLRSVQLSPNDDRCWRTLGWALRNVREVPVSAPLRAALIALFQRRDVNPRSLATAALSCVRAEDEDVFADPLFLLLLANAPIPDAEVETFLTGVRSRALHAYINQGHDVLALDALCALAQQGFLNEYVWFIPDDDAALLDRLSGDQDWRAAALLACYAPLFDTPFAARDFCDAPEPLQALVRAQIDSRRQERALSDTIPALKSVDDATSIAVRAQYEENPYPRWTRCDIAMPAAIIDVAMASVPHLKFATSAPEPAPDILIAGCGTGLQTMRVASSHPSARILAVDISRASIAYGMRKLAEYGVANVEHMQADILDLGALERRFDYIESYGVLHHMRTPEDGLGVLAGLLKPGGLMFLGIYSAIGRKAVIAARDWIAAHGFAPNPADIRRARRAIMAERPAPMLTLLSPASDFWTLSDCRDLIFHVQEHRYTLPEIGAMLEAKGLMFLGLGMPNASDKARFLAAFPGPAAARSIAAYHAFETANPDAFGETYHVWAQKS